MMKSSSKILFIILFLTTIEQIAVDIYLPSLPAMTDYFGTSASVLQYTVTVYLLGFALSPLVFGPLSDRYGRRRILILNLVLFLVAGLASALSMNVDWLLASRLVHGIASGGIVVASSAMSRDCYRGKQLIKVTSYMSMVWSLVPIIAPAIGGYIQHYLGWRENFFFVCIYSLPISLYVWWVLPETNETLTERLPIAKILGHYLFFLTNPYFMMHVLATAITFAMTIAFNTAAPFLFQEQLHLNAVQFGWLLFVVGLSYLFGTVVNSILVQYVAIKSLLRTGQALMFTASVVMLGLGLMGVMTLTSVALPAAIVIMGEGFVYPNSAALAFDGVRQNTGIAAALFGCIQLLACAGASALVARLSETSQIPLASIMLALSSVLIIGFGCLDWRKAR